MNIKGTIFWVGILFAASCTNPPQIKFDGEFADNKPFETTTLEMNPCQLDIQPLSPSVCCFLDTLLVVVENTFQVKANFFKVYYKENLIKEFGEYGNGPDDFDTPNIISAGKTEHSFIYTTESTRHSKISITPNNYDVNKEILPMPDDFILFDQVLIYNDSIIVVEQSGEYQLHQHNRITRTTNGYNYFEDAGKLNSYSNLNLVGQLYQSVSSSNGNYIVLAYHKLKIIDIISSKDMSLHKRVCFQNYDCNDYIIDNKGNIIFDEEEIRPFFSFVTASEYRFYALCWDCTNEEADSGEKRSSIYVFDYNGNIIKQYKPNVTITSFAINGNDIYAIVYDFDKEEYIICKGMLK